MCLCKNHDELRTQIQERISRPMTRGIPTLIRQAIDCHFFYNRSTLRACAQEWGVPDQLDLVTKVSEENIKLHWIFTPRPWPRKYHPCYEVLREGDSFEIIPNAEWFKWAKDDHARKVPQNLVYDEEAIIRKRNGQPSGPIKPEQDRRDDWAITPERDQRTAIPNAAKNSNLYSNPAADVSTHDSAQPEHYQRFPSMKPWQGSRYKHPSHKRLLVVGESHYLPDKSTIHLDAARWYSADERQLGFAQNKYGQVQEELGWISTSRILGRVKMEERSVKAHSIYCNIAAEVNAVGPRHARYRDALDDLAFYNYFQRPASEGLSMKLCRVPKDDEMAEKVLIWVVRDLDPQIIIFASSFAADYGKRVLQHRERMTGRHIDYWVTPHPGCAHWNMPEYTSPGGKMGLTGQELFGQILIDYHFKL